MGNDKLINDLLRMSEMNSMSLWKRDVCKRAADALSIPAIDAVPVVRCRECRNGLYSECYGNVVCCVHHWTRGPKYYCGDGKRRKDGDNDDAID